jgi:uncharacterized phage-associated protein
MAKKITSETTFPRSVTVKDTDGNIVFGWIMQPYITSMYIAYKPSGQGSIKHSLVSKYLKSTKDKAEKNGHSIEIVEATYGEFVEVEEIEKYYN